MNCIHGHSDDEDCIPCELGYAQPPPGYRVLKAELQLLCACGAFGKRTFGGFCSESCQADAKLAAECRSPGFCTCPGMRRCSWCGYTEHDKAHLMDHRFCAGPIRDVAPHPIDTAQEPK
jgi:hypothetical protein